MSIMFPYIEIFEKTIPVYGICIAIGLIASVIYIKIAERPKKDLEADIELAAIYSIIGTFVGAKLLYLAVAFPDLVQDIKGTELSFFEIFLKYTQGGFVFYGGLIGAVLAVWIYSKACKVCFSELCVVLVPVIPLFHFFGRIGCFMEGCCYGIESELFGIAFTNSPVAPNNVRLLPVQLYEAAVELVLFFILLLMVKKGAGGLTLLYTWTLAYTVARFILEFFRGDSYRGFIGALSISQVISLALAAAVILLSIFDKNKARRQETRQI